MVEKYNRQGIDALANTGKPIPGQSLTNDPDQRYAWEGPPEFTDFRKALNFITGQLLEEEILVPLMKGVGDGVPLTDIALQVLQTGFQEGKWNPDLLTMLVEPTIYTLMALAEKSNINYRVTGDEEEDLESEDMEDIAVMKSNNLKKYANNKISKESKIPAGAIPKEIMDSIDSVEIPSSLLNKEEPQEQTKEPQAQQSLLAQGGM